MRAVVLGDGIVGLHVVRALADGGHWIRPISRVNLDLTRPVPLDWFDGSDLVVNTAAMSDLDVCEARAKEAERVNALAAGEIAKAATSAGARLVHVSSDHALKPVGVYGRTRLEGERLVREHAPDATIVRFSTTFGPHPNRTDFVRWLLGELAAHGKVSVPDDMMSSPTYAIEGARFVAEAVERGVSGGLHHVANHHGISRYELANLVQRAFHAGGHVLRGKITEYPSKAPRPADTCMPMDAPSWWVPRSIEACLQDYAHREREGAAAKEGVRE